MIFSERLFAVTLALCAVMFPVAALAHGVVEVGGGFMAGFTHPIFGTDHLLAMLSVGIVSTQLPNKYAIWTLPATFVLVLAVGGAVGMSGAEFGGVEIAIALSVIVLGTSIFFGTRLPAVWVYAFVAFFAASHGYAHGMEMPEQASAGQFAAGFMVASAVIHLAGVSVGLFSTRILQAGEYLRFVGGVIAGMGLQFLLSALG